MIILRRFQFTRFRLSRLLRDNWRLLIASEERASLADMIRRIGGENLRQSKSSLPSEWLRRWLTMRQPVLLTLSRPKVKAQIAVTAIMEMVEMEMVEMEMVKMGMEIMEVEEITEMEIQMRMVEVLCLLAHVCTNQDFVKCQPFNFKGTKGVVGLTRWFKKMETVFYISNCPEVYQVKYATCTLLDSALTWWNSHKRIIRVDAAFAMTWRDLMKLMTEVFQELTLLCTRMVPGEEDRIKRYVGGLPNNIQGNVMSAEPTRLQDAIRLANSLMDHKLKGYAIRSVENKRKFKSNQRDNRAQKPSFKRQNVGGSNVTRAYTADGNEGRVYVGPHPLCNNCKLHHVGPCTVKCRSCGKIGHLTRDAVLATVN
ncbi:hypothetical protein Tco_1061947 [Tanacetum coccineum]